MHQETARARIVADGEEGATGRDSGRAFADLMLAIRDGRETEVEFSRSLPAIRWRGTDGKALSFHSDGTRWYAPAIPPDNPVDLAHEEYQGYHENMIDHMLTAIRAGWDFRIFIRNGTGVMTWDRESHGNRPAVTVDAEGNVVFHRERPEGLEPPRPGTEDGTDGRTEEDLELLAGHAAAATREGRLDWGESFRPNAFRAAIGPRRGEAMDLEVLRDAGSGRVKMVLWNHGEPVASFHPRAETGAEELLERLERSAVTKGEKVRRALEQIRELRAGTGEEASRPWVLWRTVDARDESEDGTGDCRLETEIHLTDPEGAPVDWDFWESALDYFLQYDDLNTFVGDTDCWHSRVDHLLTGTAFEFDLDELDPEAERPELSGRAARYVAVESRGREYHTYRDEDQIVSQIGFRMHFADAAAARPVLRCIKEG